MVLDDLVREWTGPAADAVQNEQQHDDQCDRETDVINQVDYVFSHI